MALSFFSVAYVPDFYSGELIFQRSYEASTLHLVLVPADGHVPFGGHFDCWSIPF